LATHISLFTNPNANLKRQGELFDVSSHRYNSPCNQGKRGKRPRPLNAEQATAIAVDFLRRLGNKRRLKPKSATLQNEIYTVKVELKKAMAKVQIDLNTRKSKSIL